jgi:hypothetical protein
MYMGRLSSRGAVPSLLLSLSLALRVPMPCPRTSHQAHENMSTHDMSLRISCHFRRLQPRESTTGLPYTRRSPEKGKAGADMPVRFSFSSRSRHGNEKRSRLYEHHYSLAYDTRPGASRDGPAGQPLNTDTDTDTGTGHSPADPGESLRLRLSLLLVWNQEAGSSLLSIRGQGCLSVRKSARGRR